MAVYSPEYADDYSRLNTSIYGETDVPAYADWATTIDFVHGSIYGYETYDYTISLEILKGGRWSSVELLNGYFKHEVKRSFSLAGKSAGTYRITGYYTPRGTKTTYINNTNPFTVNR